MITTVFTSLFAILLSAMSVQAQVCGDADASGTTNLSDGVAVLRDAAGLDSSCTGRICDIDGDGTVSVSDGVATLRMAARLPAAVSCGTRFGELVKTASINGVTADLHLGPPPSSTPGAPQDVVSIEGASEVTSGETARFLLTLARKVESLVIAFKDNGVFVDGYAQLDGTRDSGSVDLDLTIGDVAGDVVSDLQVAGSAEGKVGGFQARPLAIKGALRETFEGALDGRLLTATVGVSSDPAAGGAGVKEQTALGSAHAYGFGRSGCGANCFNSHTSSVFIRFGAPRLVARIRFRYIELFSNWGSNGTIYIDGVSLTGGRDFQGLPSNGRRPDATFTEGTWEVGRTAEQIELRVVDITNLSEIYIDDLVVE